MKKITLIMALLLMQWMCLHAQERIMYVVDSVPVMKDPDEDDQLLDKDIAEMALIKNPDSIKMLGYEKMDAIMYIFTHAYKNRPDSLKQIPTTRRMEKINDVWMLAGKPYTGRFIDYFYSGLLMGEGNMTEGKLQGKRTQYFNTGNLHTETTFVNGTLEGMEKEYYEDGTLKQQGNYKAGKEEGMWEMFYPNGQVKLRAHYTNGKGNGPVTRFYSNGRMMEASQMKNGKLQRDKALDKILQLMDKGAESYQQGNFSKAIDYYKKAADYDTMFAEAYLSVGLVKMNMQQFDTAIAYFNKAIAIEPYYKEAISNRAFALLTKYQLLSGNMVTQSNNRGVSMMKAKKDLNMPAEQRQQLCTDLANAWFLGDKSIRVRDARNKQCFQQDADE